MPHPILYRLRQHEETSHVLREQVAVRRLNQGLPNALLDEPGSAQAAAETRPQIVVLPHGVIQPAHVIGMAHRVARVAQADDLIDCASLRHPEIGQPGGGIRRGLPSEPILRSQHDVGTIAARPEGLDDRSRDHHVPALRHRRARRHDGDTHGGDACRGSGSASGSVSGVGARRRRSAPEVSTGEPDDITAGQESALWIS